jgi:hypothetical protein
VFCRASTTKNTNAVEITNLREAIPSPIDRFLCGHYFRCTGYFVFQLIKDHVVFMNWGQMGDDADLLFPEDLGARQSRVLVVSTLTLWREDALIIDDLPSVRQSVHLDAHVQIGAEIGRGATGIVFAGKVLETGETIAIKQFALVCDLKSAPNGNRLTLVSFQGRKSDLQAMDVEMEMLKSLSHPNVIRYEYSLSLSANAKNI